MVWNALVLAMRALRRNLMRSTLTMLGIVIGIAAVITMVNLGAGATAQVTAQIASLGSNLLTILPGQRFTMGQTATAKPFKMADAEAIAQEISAIIAVVPMSSQSIIAIFGNEHWSTTITGTDNRFFTVREWSIAIGRLFTESELRAGKAVCILGATVRRQLFGSQDPLGSKIRLKHLSCQVIGILTAKGQSAIGRDQDDLVLVPLRTFWRRIAGNQDIGLIQVSARAGAATEQVKRDLEALMRERRRITPSEDDDFNVRDMQELVTMLTGTTQVLTALLGAVAAVSLLVGGIGIMNIMLVSVTERTREIGIRLAIGALEREVLMQFLVEAVVLSALGGVVGIVVAVVASMELATLLQVPFVFNTGIAGVALLFSAAVGVIFGYFPARKAAHLDPIEALRYE
jgi:putative ABC transport system permease protein